MSAGTDPGAADERESFAPRDHKATIAMTLAMMRGAVMANRIRRTRRDAGANGP